VAEFRDFFGVVSTLFAARPKPTKIETEMLEACGLISASQLYQLHEARNSPSISEAFYERADAGSWSV
jgi:hypothetical protein